MTESDEDLQLSVTLAAQEEIATVVARHPHPVIVRLRILPGPPPMAQMYLSSPRREDKVMEYGSARLVIDRDSREYLRGATVDFHPGKPQGGFSVDGPRLGPGSSGSPPGTPDSVSFEGRAQHREAPEVERETRLREALRQVYDPEIPVNIVDLGLIYGIDWTGDGKALIRMTMTSPGCPVAGMLEEEVRAVAERVPGVRGAEVRIVWDPPWDPGRMSEATRHRFGYA
jgi:metal-sulfur cluster biosynthetic enzyme/Fe-S cluster assembly iron-binding protein IscA